MDKATSRSPKGSGSVKAVVNFNGKRIHGRKPDYKTQFPRPEETSSKARELHLAKLDMNRLNESKKSAEEEKAQAESELHRVRSAVKELAQQIDEFNAKVKARRMELKSLRKSHRIKEEHSSLDGDRSGNRHVEVMRELDRVKQEVSQLKLDVVSALEAKAKAEKEIEASSSKVRSYESSKEELRREIEEANEEQMLVELARMEAAREHREIEDQRVVEATLFSKTIEAARKRIKELRKETSRTKELEMKLAVTTSDVCVLQNEMELVRAMERSFQCNQLEKDFNKRREEEKESSSLLQSAKAELKAAKEELASIKEEGFQFMTSMDLVREALTQVAKETERLKNTENKADATVQHLNSKLLKAKSKLESASVADEKAKAIISNLSVALQQLQTEIEAARRDKELITEETRAIKTKIEKADLSINSAEERLQAAMKELEAVKASEATALKKLKHVTESTMRNRASSSLNGSTISISKWEYEYLSRRAAAALEIADKKVVASKAWIDAVKARETEIGMRTQQAKKEIKELTAVEEQEAYKSEKTLIAQEAMQDELRSWKQDEQEAVHENPQLTVARRRKSMRENGMPAGQRRAKMRRTSASSGTRHHEHSPSFTIKRRRKVTPYLVKLLQGQRNGKQK